MHEQYMLHLTEQVLCNEGLTCPGGQTESVLVCLTLPAPYRAAPLCRWWVKFPLLDWSALGCSQWLCSLLIAVGANKLDAEAMCAALSWLHRK